MNTYWWLIVSVRVCMLQWKYSTLMEKVSNWRDLRLRDERKFSGLSPSSLWVTGCSSVCICRPVGDRCTAARRSSDNTMTNHSSGLVIPQSHKSEWNRQSVSICRSEERLTRSLIPHNKRIILNADSPLGKRLHISDVSRFLSKTSWKCKRKGISVQHNFGLERSWGHQWTWILSQWHVGLCFPTGQKTDSDQESSCCNFTTGPCACAAVHHVVAL